MISKNNTCDLFIFSGETSGDILGNSLLAELLQKKPDLNIVSVAGPLMRKHPIQKLMPMEEFQTMGFSDVLLSLPKMIKKFYSLRNWILQNKPKVVVFIDFPEFTLRLEKSLKKHHFQGKIVHYVCPTIWAWRKNRLNFMQNSIDLLLTLFPFEQNYITNQNFKVSLVQHPLFERSQQAFQKKPPTLQKTNFILGIFPGSRKKVIKKNLKKQLLVMNELIKLGYSFKNIYISCSDSSFLPLIQDIIASVPNSSSFSTFTAPCEKLMKKVDLAIATSGTVGLQLSFFEIPTVITYAINSFDLFLAQKVFKIHLNHYSLANILAQKMIFPEFFGPTFHEKNVYKALQNFIENPYLRLSCQLECQKIKKLFLNSKSAASQILPFF